MKLFFILSICIELVCGRLSGGLFPKCSKGDPNIEQCFIQSVEAIRPLLIQGIPEVAFPSLEPFTMNQINVDSGVPGLKLRGLVTNIVAKGAGNFRILNAKLDFNKNTAVVIVMIPKLDVTADYQTKGAKVLFVSADSTGKFKGSFNNVKAVITARGKLDYDDEEELSFIRVPYVTVSVDIGTSPSISVVPDGGRITAKWASKMINAAPTRVLLKMLSPVINSVAAPILKKYINRVLDELPLEDILA